MTNEATVRSVVRYIGTATLALILVTFLLLRQVIRQANGAGTIDAATLGAVTSLGTLTGTALGALGALLVSTRTGNAEPQQVEVVGPDPLPVEEQPEE